MSERQTDLIDLMVAAYREFSCSYNQGQKVLDYLLALEAKLEAMEQELEEERGLKERLAWAIRMVLNDFQDNNSPCLSQAAVNAIWVVEPAAAQEEADNLADARAKGRKPTGQHGTWSKYMHGCRCDDCWRAMRQRAKARYRAAQEEE